MATKKKSSSIKVPAKKKTASTKAKSSKASSKTKVSTKAIPVPQGREHKLAEQALKLVDEASSILRSGIRGSAATTAKSRIAAKKKANDLLGKASHNLTKALAESTAALQKLIEKI
jgi:hypothetical protein